MSANRFQVAGQTRDFTYQSTATGNYQKKMQWVKRSFAFTATAAKTVIAFYAYYTPGNTPLGPDNVQVRAIQPADGIQPAAAPGQAPGPAAGVTTLHIATASVTAGGQETIQVVAGKNAALTLVIDYPDGSQSAVPAHAGPDGLYSYNWAVPSTVHGTVHVFVDAAGSIAQGSFAVS